RRREGRNALRAEQGERCALSRVASRAGQVEREPARGVCAAAEIGDGVTPTVGTPLRGVPTVEVSNRTMDVSERRPYLRTLPNRSSSAYFASALFDFNASRNSTGAK